jgi:hypothetical protein
MCFYRKGERGMPKPKLGSGKRFEQLEKKIAAKGDVENPKAVAAAIGRKKYGAKKMAKMAAAGKRKKK